MNYQHIEHEQSERVVQRAAAAVQQKKASDAKRIEHLNQLTRYPSLIAVVATGVALLSAIVHVIR